MTQTPILPPRTEEYAPYYGKYVSLVAGDIIGILEVQLADISNLLSPLTERQAESRYSPEKWSIKEVLGHIVDAERIFSYRALRISRNDKTPIEGFEQDDYVRYGPFSSCRFSDLIAEFNDVRKSTLALFRSLAPEAWSRRGIASQNEVSVRALAFVIAGHLAHHRNVLEQKYFPLLRG